MWFSNLSRGVKVWKLKDQHRVGQTLVLASGFRKDVSLSSTNVTVWIKCVCLWLFCPVGIKPLTRTHWSLWSTDREHVNALNWGLSCSSVFLYHVFQASAEVNHHATVPPLAVSSDTMAAILDYCVFTKLVCPLPPSRSVTFPLALPSSPGKRGLSAAMAMKKGVQLEGDWRLTVAAGTWPHAALCHTKIRQNKSVGMTDVSLSHAG